MWRFSRTNRVSSRQPVEITSFQIVTHDATSQILRNWDGLYTTRTVQPLSESLQSILCDNLVNLRLSTELYSCPVGYSGAWQGVIAGYSTPIGQIGRPFEGITDLRLWPTTHRGIIRCEFILKGRTEMMQSNWITKDLRAVAGLISLFSCTAPLLADSSTMTNYTDIVMARQLFSAEPKEWREALSYMEGHWKASMALIIMEVIDSQ